MYLYHKATFVRRMVPNFVKLNGLNVPLYQVIFVPKRLKAEIVAKVTKQLTKPPTVMSPEDMGTLKRQCSRNSRLATSTMSLNTTKRFDTEDELDNTAPLRD